MGIGEFNSHNHYIYYWGQESLRRNGVAFIVNKRVQKQQNDLSLFTRQTIQYHSSPSLWTTNSEEAEVEWFYEDLQDLLEHQRKMSFSS